MTVTPADWFVVESRCDNLETGETVDFVSLVPSFGPEHVMSPECWCHPATSQDNVITHNVMH